MGNDFHAREFTGRGVLHVGGLVGYGLAGIDVDPDGFRPLQSSNYRIQIIQEGRDEA